MKNTTIAIVLLTVLIFSGCVHIEPPHSGTVKDAETGKPIKGVVVHIDIESAFLIPAAEGITKYKDGYEAITDEEGKYSLPIKIKAQAPLEISRVLWLSFIKAGYSTLRIADPSSNNDVILYPVKYYLDYYSYRESAKNGDLDPPFMDEKPEAFIEYKAELRKMSSMQMDAIGEKSVFLEIPGTRLSKLLNIGVNFYVFDEISQKWFAFDMEGHVSDPNNSLLSKYSFFGGRGEKAIYANPDLIYLPADSPIYPDRYITPQKGNISALIRDNFTYLTIEDYGQSICYYEAYSEIRRGCLTYNDAPSSIDTENRSNRKWIALTGNDQFSFAVSKAREKYEIFRILSPSSPWNSTPAFTINSLPLTIPAETDIVAFDSAEGYLYIIFANNIISKYSLGKVTQGPIKEIKRFQTTGGNMSSIFLSHGLFYYTKGNSKIYRVSSDGIEDFRIKIISDVISP